MSEGIYVERSSYLELLHGMSVALAKLDPSLQQAMAKLIEAGLVGRPIPKVYEEK